MTKIPGIIFSTLLLVPTFLFAQNIQPNAAWQKVRDQQPKALHLKMTLVKDHFFQGEEIDATLEYSNDDPNTLYSFETAWWEPGAKFHAMDRARNPVIDPLGWCQEWISGRSAGGLMQINRLGQCKLTLPVNEDVRFDSTGTFQIYAQAHLEKGTDLSSPSSVDLVSDPTEITITPITPEQEKQVIAEAVPKIKMVDSTSGLDEATREGVNALKYLQTPDARAELIKLMTRSQLVEPTFWGLLAAPDPKVEAAHLLAAVQTGKLVLGPYGVTLYSELKTSELLQYHSFPKDASNPEDKKLSLEIERVMKEARQELTSAMIQCTAQHGPAHAEALWTAFEQVCSGKGWPSDKGDLDGGKARKAVAEYQLELSDATVERLLTYWSSYGSPDFLPLVRREVAKRGNNPNALLALCDIKPDEARSVVLAEMTRPDSNFFKGTYDYQTLLYIPSLPLPELDGFFESKLADTKEPPARVVPLIVCFGSPKLLPAVQKLFLHQDSTYFSGGPRDRLNLYYYWMRCNPQAATADFERDFNSGDRDCWTFLWMTLTQKWSDFALPLVRFVVKNDKTNNCSGDMDLLLKHGFGTDMDLIIEALENRKNDKDFGRAIHIYFHLISDDPNWHLTDAQKKRLEALAN